MSVSDCVIEYKTRTLAGGKQEHFTRAMAEKMAEFRSAKKVTQWTSPNTDDHIRVWVDQTTLDEYNAWMANNGEKGCKKANDALGHIIKKTEFTAR
jgi:hypothetical protein